MMQRRDVRVALVLVFLSCCHATPVDDVPPKVLTTDKPVNPENPSGKEAERNLNKRNAFVERTLSSPGSPFTITLVEQAKSRDKRAVSNATKPWPRKIPYVIDASFTKLGVSKTIILKRAMQYIMDRVCITLVDVTNNFTSYDVNWLADNGFETSSYISIHDAGRCYGQIGPGSKEKRLVSPCTGFEINLHEMGHAVGSMHVQESPIRDNYMTVNTDNIQRHLRFSYRKYADMSSVISLYFDPSSSLMYGPNTFTRNGLETYSTIRDDFFHTIGGSRRDDVMFYELSQLYKCRETFCNTEDVDCSPGYYTLVKGVCRCVCPEERDESTQCKTLRNGPSTTTKWPDTPIVLMAGGPQHTCPTGFKPGWFSFTGKYDLSQYQTKPPVLFPSSGTYSEFPLCTKDTPTGANVNWESWPPGGQYCIIKPANDSCGGAFVESKLEIQSLGTVKYNGSIGDTTVNGNNITQKYCCRIQESYGFPTEFPNAEPFRLLTRSSCPKIRGIKSVNTRNNWWSPIYTVTNASTSPWWLYPTCLTTYTCYYLPPVYGCNQEITLDAKTKTTTVTTPGFPNAREPNRRCFYTFNIPRGSQLKITFNIFDLSVASDDTFLVKRFHKWQDPYRIDENNYPSEILSEGDYLSVEYWSGFAVSTKKGVSFTATLILPEDQCYDIAQKGADYSGNTHITETYEECLDWSLTVECEHYPTSDALWLLGSNNSCRNPDGALIQPWCYVNRNGDVCQKRYCDVCNLKSTVDSIKTCSSLIAADPDFCSTSLSRYGCAKSCSYTPIPSTRGTCKAPTAPSDGTLVSTDKSTYYEGDVVQVKCTASGYNPVSEMKCTNSGWTTLTSACKGGCEDKVSFCQDHLRTFPRFCRHKKTKTIAEQYCAKSCRVCSGTSTCKDPSVRTFSRTSSTDTIKTGEFMTFTCKAGLYYWSGDKERACGLNGVLLGTNLDCKAQPPVTDVNLNFVRKRTGLLKTNTAYLVDKDEYKVPFKGKITRWYYYCKTAGVLNFAVYRKVNKAYTYVGANNITCQPDFMMTYNVPTHDQISVEAMDIFAVHSTASNTLYVTDCDDRSEKLLNTRVITAKTFADLATKGISGTYCLIPSFGARLQPV